MITALISTIAGLISGLAPDMLKEFSAGRDHVREIEFLRLQNQLQRDRMTAEAGAKLQISENELMVEQARAYKDHMVALTESAMRPTGIKWIDGFNSLLRPLTCMVFITLLAMVALGLSNVIDQAAFSGLFIEACQAVLGFLFGYRSARKPAATYGPVVA